MKIKWANTCECAINHYKSSAILKLGVSSPIKMFLQNVVLDLERLEDGWLAPSLLSNVTQDKNNCRGS